MLYSLDTDCYLEDIEKGLYSYLRERSGFCGVYTFGFIEVFWVCWFRQKCLPILALGL